ncbi:hypothetical protein [Roseisalinus antarcticus]|uniref:Uncharacterized protein n=1 Tax=Roseisalinus antarcticus TaxID=254357 RepID=A0A1Y5RZX8_9RHOB|nr:hypothetical protein [Roseisalinus antarcticus]SLN28383.1 hypothetical protein ROA7023_00959 [Roseisalinus antarcticus]
MTHNIIPVHFATATRTEEERIFAARLESQRKWARRRRLLRLRAAVRGRTGRARWPLAARVRGRGYARVPANLAAQSSR